ncbi:MAG: chromosomal replication initiator protein DnaA [Pirellulales bacterium]
MATDDMEIVSAVRLCLADKVGAQRFELWFARTKLRLHQGVLTVLTTTRFYNEWLRTHFRDELEEACIEVTGSKPRLDFRVDADGAGSSHAAAATKSNRVAPATISMKGRAPEAKPMRNRSTSSAVRVPERPARSRSWASLETLVVGDSNKLAATSAEMAAKRPGSISPLLIHGPTGVGKTHLLEGIRTAAVQVDRRTHVVYMTAEQFTSAFLEALSGGGLPNFRRKHRGLDILVIDDVQFFEGKKATLGELLCTIDDLLAAGRQVVVASDRPPAELQGFSPELAARLVGGLVCGIESPDYAMRLGIARRLSARLDVEVPEEVLGLVASRMTLHARQLAGALHRLQATSLAHGQPITLEMAEAALDSLAQSQQCVVRLADVQRAVCNVFGLAADSLRSNVRRKNVRQPRMLAMWLARKYTRAGLAEIGEFFGCRSHSTVISANKKVETWMHTRTPVASTEQSWDIEEAIRRVEATLRRA